MKKLLQIGNIAGVSLLGFVMMFAAVAPTMNNAYAGDPASDFCQSLSGPGWVGVGVVGDITLVKCFDLNDPCFAQGVPVKANGPTTCEFVIFYINTTGENVILKDSVPAEWSAEFGFRGASDGCLDNLEQANKNQKADKSATLLTCDATNDAGINGAHIVITTRESPGSLKGNQEIAKFKPTSCELFANSGAQLILADELGEPVLDDLDQPIVLAETGPIQVPVTGEECEQPDG